MDDTLREKIRQMAEENGLDADLLEEAFEMPGVSEGTDEALSEVLAVIETVADDM